MRETNVIKHNWCMYATIYYHLNLFYPYSWTCSKGEVKLCYWPFQNCSYNW